MISNAALFLSAGRIMLMPFFPSDPMTKAALQDELRQIADTDERLKWLVRRVLQLYTEWPGITEIRAVYCARYHPADGVECYSAVYPSGIPSEREPEARSYVELPAGHVVTADAELDCQVQVLAEVKRLPGKVNDEETQ